MKINGGPTPPTCALSAVPAGQAFFNGPYLYFKQADASICRFDTGEAAVLDPNTTVTPMLNAVVNVWGY